MTFNFSSVYNVISSQLSGMSKVGIYKDGVSLLTNSKIISDKVSQTATIPSHTVEDGSNINDYIVYNPNSIDLQIFVPIGFLSDWENIIFHFKSGTVLTVVCKSGIFNDMVIQAIPTEEKATHLNGIILSLSLKEVKFATFEETDAPPKTKKNKTNGKAKPKPTAKKKSVTAKKVTKTTGKTPTANTATKVEAKVSNSSSTLYDMTKGLF